jgi:predicted DCC family thiol-disulfide oxidoreductase YuxK
MICPSRRLRYRVGMNRSPDWEFKLLYDGQCPMCRREAAWLQKRSRDGRLAFEDISAPDFDAARYGKSQSELMGVMHGVFPDGRIVTRVEAFRQAYRAVGLGWLLAPTRLPGLSWLADRAYEWFARHRIAIGKRLGVEDCQDGRCEINSKPR